MSFDADRVFAGSIPQIYNDCLVPLIFQPYADDMSRRVRDLQPRRVLEIAAGTGALTRAMSLLLPSEVSIVAVDLNPAMLDHARAVGAAGHVQWRIADAMALPFDDKTFDVVVCQFGAMFFPDKSLAFSEARRVLARRGTFLFSVWDRIEDNEFADIATAAVADLFPTDPPSFLSRTPHGYFDYATIKSDLRRAGFEHPPETVTLPARSRALSAQIPAFAYCQGTPMRNEIEVRDPTQLEKATDLAAEAIAARFGRGEVDGKIQAKIFSVAR